MKPSRFLAEAEQEMLAAADFYEYRAAGLGREFLTEIKRLVDVAENQPELGVVLAGNVRRLITKRFPFGVLYRIGPDEIVVVAVMHQRRHPKYWRKRT